MLLWRGWWKCGGVGWRALIHIPAPLSLIRRRQSVCYMGSRAAQWRLSAHMESPAGWALTNKGLTLQNWSCVAGWASGWSLFTSQRVHTGDKTNCCRDPGPQRHQGDCVAISLIYVVMERNKVHLHKCSTSILLSSLYFTWVFKFSTTLYLLYTTFWRQMLYPPHNCLITSVSLYFTHRMLHYSQSYRHEKNQSINQSINKNVFIRHI